MKPGLAHCLAAAIFLSCAPGCNRTPLDNPAGAGRHKIITLAPHITETVFAIGRGDRVVGVSSFCDYPPQVKDLPDVGGYVDPNLERIAVLEPELIILGGKHEKVAQYAGLRHIDILQVHMDSLATIYVGIERIGEALDAAREAQSLCTEIKGELAGIKNAVQGLDRPAVLAITSRSRHDLNSLFTVGGTSFVSELIDTAGGHNIYRDADRPYIEASKETVVMEQPEVIIEFHAGENLSDRDRSNYVDDWRVLKSIPAVKNNRIHIITASHALRPGPRIAEIAGLIAKCIHPDVKIPEQ